MVPPGSGGIVLGAEILEHRGFLQLVRDRKLAWVEVSAEAPAAAPPPCPTPTPTPTLSISEEVEMKLVEKATPPVEQPTEPTPSKKDRLGPKKGKSPEPEGGAGNPTPSP
jgi:hypothetical protein